MYDTLQVKVPKREIAYWEGEAAEAIQRRMGSNAYNIGFAIADMKEEYGSPFAESGGYVYANYEAFDEFSNEVLMHMAEFAEGEGYEINY